MAGIDWLKTQANIGARADGSPGRETFGLILRTVASSNVPTPTIERIAQSLAKSYAAYAMTTPVRLAEFIAEIAHETGGFMRFEEDLNYSAKRLAQVWPNRYAVDPKATEKVPNAKALSLAGRPEALANDTYGLRMGNLPGAQDNDVNPDGWQYRGRSPIMLTGRAQYAQAGPLVGLDLIGNPDLAADPFLGVTLSLDYFRRRGINALVDAGDFIGARKAVNGGVIGLADVAAKRIELRKVIV